MLFQDFFPGWQESLKAKQSAYETTRPGKEVGKTVDQGNMKERLVTFGNQEYVQ